MFENRGTTTVLKTSYNFCNTFLMTWQYGKIYYIVRMFTTKKDNKHV